MLFVDEAEWWKASEEMKLGVQPVTNVGEKTGLQLLWGMFEDSHIWLNKYEHDKNKLIKNKTQYEQNTWIDNKLQKNICNAADRVIISNL